MSRLAAPLSVVCALAALALAPPASAQGIGLPNQNRDAPIEIHADDGIEWRQDIQAYIARGNARAVQGEVSVLADTLTAYYRKAETGEAPRGETSVGGASQGGNEIIRIDADGNVRIVSPRQTAYGAKAVYDVEKSILVLTGKPRMVTDTDEITAQRSLEFWEQRSMAVARGDAIAVRGDKRLRADVLTAHFKDDADGKAQMERIDAFDNVLISSPAEIVRGNQGVYDVKTGIAVLKGSVKITRGEDQLNGDGAEVNLNTGVSRLLSDPDSRVTGTFRARRANPAPAETPEGGATDGKAPGR